MTRMLSQILQYATRQDRKRSLTEVVLKQGRIRYRVSSIDVAGITWSNATNSQPVVVGNADSINTSEEGILLSLDEAVETF